MRFQPRHLWTGWTDDGALAFDTPHGPAARRVDATILALGGASWPHLGSDGTWVSTVTAMGVAVAPLVPSNCAVAVPWTALFRDRFEGQPLKAVALTVADRTARGDAVVTRDGLEGGAVYALSGPLREGLDRNGEAVLHIALRPDLGPTDLAARLGTRVPKRSLSTHLHRTLHLAPVAVGLLQEAAHGTGRPLGDLAPEALAALVNAIPVRVTGMAPITRAISSAGGVRLGEVDEGLMFRRRPGVWAVGEMLDWDAPTGGYLLQAAFATGSAAGRSALAHISRESA